MKGITILFATLLCALLLITEAAPPLPPNFPEELKAEFQAIGDEIEKLPKNSQGFPDFSQISADLKARMDKLRADYEAKTGQKWPMPPGPPPSQ